MSEEMRHIIDVLIALGAAGIFSFAVTPLARLLAYKVGAIDVPKDERRVHKTPVPRLGGLAVFAGFFLSYLLFGDINEQIRGVLVGGVLMVVIGAIDDVLALRWYVKLPVQIVAALCAVLSGVVVEQFQNPFAIGQTAYFQLGAFSVPITVIWIVLITNAVNLIDGLDGLAVGVSAIASLSMLLIALVTGNEVTALLLAALLGGCLGFIPYNFNPARLFMGDSGALFLGYILSASSIMGLFKFYAAVSFVVPFLIMGLPIFDTAAAFLRRLFRGQNPMKPDRGHIHHKLIDMGLSQKQAVAVLYTMSAILGLSAVIVATAKEIRALVLLLAVLAALGLNISFILLQRRRRGTALHKAQAEAQTEAAVMSDSRAAAETESEAIDAKAAVSPQSETETAIEAEIETGPESALKTEIEPQIEIELEIELEIETDLTAQTAAAGDAGPPGTGRSGGQEP